MDSFFDTLEEIFEDPEDYQNFYLGSTPLHLISTGLVAPVEDLLQLKIPIFLAAAGDDSLVPMASIDVIRLEFLRKGRRNLDYRFYPGLDHGFFRKDTGKVDEETVFQMPTVFDDFCDWFSGLPSDFIPK